VFFSTYDGVRDADLELRNVARILGTNRWQLFWHVTIPNASPWIISGLRIAIPQALVATVVAEFIASTEGLGYRIMEKTKKCARYGRDHGGRAGADDHRCHPQYRARPAGAPGAALAPETARRRGDGMRLALPARPHVQLPRSDFFE